MSRRRECISSKLWRNHAASQASVGSSLSREGHFPLCPRRNSFKSRRVSSHVVPKGGDIRPDSNRLPSRRLRGFRFEFSDVFFFFGLAFVLRIFHTTLKRGAWGSAPFISVTTRVPRRDKNHRAARNARCSEDVIFVRSFAADSSILHEFRAFVASSYLQANIVRL